MTGWVVVGAGTAGCVVAARLSEDPSNEVTLLEAGDDRGALAATFLLERARPGAMWAGEYPIGRGLGGTSAVNGGVLSGDVSRLAATELALAGHRRRTRPGRPGAARVGRRRGARPARPTRRAAVSVADCYLESARSRPNLGVRTGVEVDRVLRRGSRAVGVVTVEGERVDADRVVLCGGAIQSPALLLRSGITGGDPGTGLLDHPGRAVDLTLRAGVVDERAPIVIGVALRRGAAEYLSMNCVDGSSTRTAAVLVGVLSAGRRGVVGLDRSGRAAVSFAPLAAEVERALDAAVAVAASLVTSDAFAAIVESWRIAPGHGAYAHATSTSAAGRVVDEHGAVLGCADLFVADASVLSALPASGTYLPVVLEAERLAARGERAIPSGASTARPSTRAGAR